LIPIFLRSSSTNCFHLSCTFRAFWFIQLFCMWGFVTMNFYSVGSLATCLNQPTWRTRVSLLVWHLPQNLSGMGGATSSYAAASKAFELLGTHKPTHPATKCFQQGGDTILGDLSLIIIIIRGATALTNLGQLSSCRWQSFPTAPDGTGLTCGQHIESHSCIFSFPNQTVTSLFK
jgi:hypothetical protein